MTYRDAVAAYLQARPGEWVDGLELARIGGAYAWRSRLAECRTQLGMTIENSQVRDADGKCQSRYRYVPSQPVDLMDALRRSLCVLETRDKLRVAKADLRPRDDQG